jgi:hypothetical protein
MVELPPRQISCKLVQPQPPETQLAYSRFPRFPPHFAATKQEHRIVVHYERLIVPIAFLTRTSRGIVADYLLFGRFPLPLRKPDLDADLRR